MTQNVDWMLVRSLGGVKRFQGKLIKSRVVHEPVLLVNMVTYGE